MSPDTIHLVANLGFNVYMRDKKDTWLIFTDPDGKRLGYLQVNRFSGYDISTIHHANATSGTGFQVERDVPELTRGILEFAFQHAPPWADQRDVKSVRKYKDIDDYRAASNFNSKYQLVAKAKA